MAEHIDPTATAAPPRGTSRHISNDCFRAIANYTYDWESWHAPEGQLLWVNAAVERMTGYRPDECLGMEDYPLPLVAPEDRDRIEHFLKDAKAGNSGNDLEFRCLHRDGKRRWMAVSWQPMWDDAGVHLGFRASVRDIEERHQLREELRLHNQHLEQLVQERTARIAHLEQQRLKMEKLAAIGQLAAGVAHEVNNPLAGIRNAFTLFRSNLSPEDEHFELLELIDREIERISSITHQMYQLYRPIEQDARRFVLERAVSDVVALLEPVARKASVTIQRRTLDECRSSEATASGPGEASETVVVLREGEVKQILFNLIRNAIQASSAGGMVAVHLIPRGTLVRIQVVDQGHGIAPEVLPKIFDPFFSTKGDASKQGMGLGLSVTRSLVEAMGGVIRVDSEVGKGSLFEVTMPRQVENPGQGADPR